MKHFLSFMLLTLFIVSCKKDGLLFDNVGPYMAKVQAALKDSMQQASFSGLDFSKAIQSRINKDTIYLRIPVKGKLLQNEFVLLQTNDYGIIARGRVISMNGSTQQDRPTNYNGSIIINSLSGEELVQSDIINGYITAFHPKMFKRQQQLTGITSSAALVEPAPVYEELPEVVVVGHRSSDGGMSYGSWMSFVGMYGGGSGGPNGGYSGSGGTSGYYGSSDGYGGSSSYGGGGGSTGGSGQPSGGGGGKAYQDPPMLIDFEEQADNAAIDIEKFLKCFDAILDAGSTSSITLSTDIPVDKDYRKLFDWGTGAPGHVFVTITKQNGTQRVSQNIGFYPKIREKVALTPAPVEGKFVNNAGHEFNAEFRMDLTPENLRRTLTHIRYLARFIKYDIDEYNCTDFAIDVFNASRVDKLDIPLYDIPGGITAAGSRTPNGLYYRLYEMVAQGHPEAKNITTGIIKGWAGGSSGPCN
jgi:hypothetical protein